MDLQDGASEHSASSSKTRGSSVGLGPVDIDGTIFLKVRQCPLSGVKNTDANVVTDGPWGPSFSKHAIWNRGSSQNPTGRFERLSALTWEHGGFADASPSIDEFADQVRKDHTLQKHFKAAYAEMVKIVTEGRMRFRGDQKGR